MDAAAPARFWGITFTTADIDAAAELLGDKLGRVKDAVQPGRRIATVRTEAGLGLPVALISPKALGGRDLCSTRLGELDRLARLVEARTRRGSRSPSSSRAP